MKRSSAAPWRRLLLLAGLVLLAHLWLLQWEARPVIRPAERTGPSFSTRTIEPAPAAGPPEPAAAAPASLAAAAPPPLPQAAVQPVRPVPVVAARSPSMAPQQPPLARAAPESGPTLVASTEPAAAPTPPGGSAPETTAAVAVAAPVAAPPATGPVAPSTAASGAAAAPASLVALPPSGRMRYELVALYKGLPLQGQAELNWRHDGRQYEAFLELRGRLLPTRSQRSAGQVTAQGLAPAYFADKSRNEQAAHFDRARGRVIFSNNAPSAPIQAGMQDRLSVLLQLAALVGGQPARYPPGTQIAVPTVSRSEAEDWIFSVEGEEDLQLPGGAMRAVKLQRKPRKEFDQKVELWLAPRMDYAPVRLRLTNSNGDTVDQRWASTDKS